MDEEELRLYSIPEAARILGIAYGTMQKVVRKEQVRTVAVGDRRMVPHGELERLVNGDPL